MTPIEIMAFIVAFFTLSKMLTMIFSQKSWFNKFTKRFWSYPKTLTVVFLIITLISLYFLIQELTIVQIIASSFFTMSLIIFGLAPLSKYMLNIEDRWFKEEKMIKTGVLQWIVWAGLSLWVLYALFA